MRDRAARFALLTTLSLTAFKVAVGLLSGSIGVLSEGIHSFLDVISSSLSYFTVREAGKPADQGHPFGHGKIETLSSLFEALLLVVAGAWICFEAARNVRAPHPIRHEGAAIAVILVSLLVSYAAYLHNMRAAKETGSSALRVNAFHFLSDVVASAGILVGLLVLKFTGWVVIDSLIAFAVAAYILYISWSQVREALNELSDSRLPDSEIRAIEEVLTRFQDQDKVEEAHDLRSRRSGSTRHIDFHLVVCRYMTVEESHEVCDEIEVELSRILPGASVNIHVEPCEETSVDGSHCKPYQTLPRRRMEKRMARPAGIST